MSIPSVIFPFQHSANLCVLSHPLSQSVGFSLLLAEPPRNRGCADARTVGVMYQRAEERKPPNARWG